MNSFKFFTVKFLSLFLATSMLGFSDNQTSTVDVPQIAGKDFPFKVRVELTDFQLPNGLHSFAMGTHNGKWLLVTGRTNGMHGFSDDNNNFPPQKQNKSAIVFDPQLGITRSRSFEDPNSGLEEWQIDLLSVTSPQYLQIGETLYITGGYGVDSATGEFSTKPFLTAIDVPEMIRWVEQENCGRNDIPAKHIRHLYDEFFQVTGGSMQKIGDNPILLIVGQNFKGFYKEESNGEYTQQIRRFDIIDNGKKLKVKIHSSKPYEQDPNLRRRDLNIVPIFTKTKDGMKEEIDILSGVFTESGGIWTVPVRVSEKGDYFMPNPESPKTFKQGMNNYSCATFGLFSLNTGDMYTILLGGISFGYFEQGVFETDPMIPFTNQITAIKRDKENRYSQFLLKTTYPKIISNNVHPNNPLLFGSGALFIPSAQMLAMKKGVLHVDEIVEFEEINETSFHVGYVVGGIASTVPNTSSRLESKASPYIFKVFVDLRDSKKK